MFSAKYKLLQLKIRLGVKNNLKSWSKKIRDNIGDYASLKGELWCCGKSGREHPLVIDKHVEWKKKKKKKKLLK